MNWKLRLKNKYTLFALIGALVALVYFGLGVFGITPGITQDEVMNVVGIGLTLLVGLGVLVDPTTKGAGDSEQARQYDKPRGAADIETVLDYINEVINTQADVDYNSAPTTYETGDEEEAE